MISKLRLFLNCRRFVAATPVKSLFIVGKQYYSVDKPNAVDINFKDMMYEENEIEESNPIITEELELQSAGLTGLPIAPIDINPWIEEEEYKEGTVFEDTINRKRIILELPQPPKERSGIYEFKGIKIVLPKKLLQPATYRHRFEQDVEFLADDMRICKFEKKSGVLFFPGDSN